MSKSKSALSTVVLLVLCAGFVLGWTDVTDENIVQRLRRQRECETRSHLARLEGFELVNETLKAMARLAEYLRNNLSKLILDTVLGVRIAEEALLFITAQLENAFDECVVDCDVLERIGLDADVLQMQYSAISNAAMKTFKLKKAARERGLEKMFQPGFWRVEHDRRHFDPNLIYLTLNPCHEFKSNDTDVCLSTILNSPFGKCGNFPRECADIIGLKRCMGYPLTHQLILYYASSKIGCENMVELHTRQKASEPAKEVSLLDGFCANVIRLVLQESKQLPEMPDSQRDLFMEQIALCGHFGYKEVSKPKWHIQVLMWQQAEGCYGNSSSVLYLLENRVEKRNEVIWESNCLAHRTGVAAAALAQLLRYSSSDLAEYFVNPKSKTDC